jgi:hypothetical protein
MHKDIMGLMIKEKPSIGSKVMEGEEFDYG